MAASTRTAGAGMITYNRRPRSLWGNVSSVLLQPVMFFRAFPVTRQWLWVGLLILAITGFSAVRQPSATDSAPVVEPSMEIPPLDMGLIPAGPDGGFVPPTDFSSGSVDAQTSPNVSETAMTALLAAGGVLLTWFIQSLLLCEISLINGQRPSLGRNLQIAIWASVPLALMLVIQQIYFGLGGNSGQPGLSLLLDKWAGYAALPAFSQSVLLTLASNFTLFWLWSLVLLYLGTRYVLNGRRAAVILIVVVWVVMSIVLPALTSPGKAESPTDTPQMLPGDMRQMPLDMMLTPEIVPDAPEFRQGGGG